MMNALVENYRIFHTKVQTSLYSILCSTITISILNDYFCLFTLQKQNQNTRVCLVLCILFLYKVKRGKSDGFYGAQFFRVL